MSIQKRGAEELRGLLEANLSEYSGALTRLQWLGDHLEEYVGRWTAFHSAPQVSMSALLDSNFFVLVVVASEVMGDELQRLPTDRHVHDSYERFTNELQRIAALTERNSPEQLMALVRELREAIHKHDLG